MDYAKLKTLYTALSLIAEDCEDCDIKVELDLQENPSRNLGVFFKDDAVVIKVYKIN